MKTLNAPEKKVGNVACVGAGPASLACAAELAKAGYKVTVIEKEAKGRRRAYIWNRSKQTSSGCSRS